MPAARKRPCAICRRWFRPDARIGSRQHACGKPECQTSRRQKTQASWRRRNPVIETTEHRLTELAAERKSCDQDRINANDLRSTLAEFDSIWSSLTTREQEELIQLLVAKVGYDGRTGKVTVNFRSAGAKELCQTQIQ